MVSFEVPVKLKYTLIKHVVSKWFVEANSVNQIILFIPNVLCPTLAHTVEEKLLGDEEPKCPSLFDSR